jgi:hypothetical protein
MNKEQAAQLRKGEYVMSQEDKIAFGKRLLEAATQAVDPDDVNKSCFRGPDETTEDS